MKQKTDFIFLGLIGLMIANTISQSLMDGYVLSLNNYFGFLAWPLTLFLRLKKWKYKRHSLAFLLILATLNILNFTIWSMRFAFSIGENSSVSAEYPGINPLILLLLIFYYIVNRKSINRILGNLFRGTEEDRREEYQETVDFYVRRFSSCNDEELKLIYKNYSEYPSAAQTALTQLKAGNGKAV